MKVFKIARISDNGRLRTCSTGRFGLSKYFGLDMEQATALDIGMFFGTGDWIVERTQ